MIQQLGKYRIVERIGRGGMGMVYKAHDPMLDRTVAVKVISADVDITDDLRARFFREAQACARLSHPNVVTVYDMGDENGHLYIVMEFLEGEELRQVIAQRRHVALEDKLSMMIEVCDGLDYAHKRGIVHRDIKPGNIFVLKDSHIKLLDFGIARIATADAGLTRTGLIMGTLRYMSPEQARGRADHRSDIFSVGAVFYEFLSNRPAFPGTDPMEILDRLRSEEPTPLSEVDASLPRELADIIARSLHKDPGARYGDLAQMRLELERLRRQLTEDADRIRARLRTRFEEITRLQDVLSERIGQSFEDETVPVVGERTPSTSLVALERETATRVERLRRIAEQAETLQPAFEAAQGALEGGRLDEAVRAFERIVAQLPDHQRAAAVLQRARDARAAAALVRERLAEVQALLQQGQLEPARERLRVIGDVPAEAAELGAEVGRARAAVEQALAAERARAEAEAQRAAAAERARQEEAARQARERARRAAAGAGEQAAAARARAEATQAARYAAERWQAAGSRQAQGATAQGREDYEAAERLFGEAVKEYGDAAEQARAAAEAEAQRVAAAERARQEEAARQARERARRAAAGAGEQAAAARARAEAAQAAQYAAGPWQAAVSRQAQGAAAQERQEYEAAEGMFREALGQYEGAAREARAAAEAEARRAAEAQAAAERARREAERVRREAEQGQLAQGQARQQAETAEAGRYAAEQWAAAEAVGRESQAAWERGAHAESVGLSGQAVERYGRAREAARAARQAREKARAAADEVVKQAAGARGGAQKAEAERWAGGAWAAAEGQRQRGTAAYEREEYEQAGQLFAGAARGYAEATTSARRAAAADAADRRRAEKQARRDEKARRAEQVALAVGAAADGAASGTLATEHGRPVAPGRVPRLALGIGATAVVVVALWGYWHFSSTAPRPVPPSTTAVPPSTTAMPAPPTVASPTTPAREPTPDQSEAIQALRAQVIPRREAATSAGAERRAAATFEAARAMEQTADAAAKARDWPAARSAYGDAMSRYDAASAEAAAVLALEQKAQHAREQMTAARRAADLGGAAQGAKAPWDKAANTQRLAEAALKRGDLGKAEALFTESAQAFREADKVASASRAAEAERAQLAAMRQRLQAAEEAATLAGTARRTAEQAAAPRYAARAFGLAQQKEDDGRQRLDRREFEGAEARLREAARDYDAALHEAQRAAEVERQALAARQRQEAERQAAAARQRQEAEEAAAAARRSTTEMRTRALANRDQAVKGGAEALAKDVFASATARESEGDRLAGAQDMVAARQAYQDAADRYLEAGRRAKILQDARTAADQARARMAAEKERARPDAAEWSAAIAQERQGTQHYQRLAFREAGESFASAAELFVKAARPPERPPERRPTAADEVRSVLDDYMRAFETRDVSLMQKVRPGLKPDELRRLRDSFDQSREYRVTLKVDSLNVTGDEAVVTGRREDNLVSKRGQSFRNESSFTFKLKRTTGGWVIDAVN